MTSSLRRPAPALLARYAGYHRDRRNVAAHCIGIPLIVFGVVLWLSWPVLEIGGLRLSPAVLLWVVSSGWYLTRGDAVLGMAVSVVNGALVALAARAAADGAPVFLLGTGLFVVGWVVQFIGHAYERRKPAFLDDLVGLLVGPMFVCAEVLFALGLCGALRRRVEGDMRPGSGTVASERAG